MTDTFSLGDIVGPILADIGYDFARLCELSDDDVVTMFAAHARARTLLVAQLVADVGDANVAERLLEHARNLPEKKQRVRRQQFSDAVEENRKPRPRLLAAHIAYSIDIETVLAIELEKRARGSPTN